MKHAVMILACLGLAGPAFAQAGGVSAEKFVAKRVTKAMAADADKDGKVSSDEWMKAHAASKGNPARAFKKADANSDGFLTPDELKAVAQKRFAKLDKDHDGLLTKEEAHPTKK
jgi:hypothetical protein